MSLGGLKAGSAGYQMRKRRDTGTPATTTTPDTTSTGTNTPTTGKPTDTPLTGGGTNGSKPKPSTTSQVTTMFKPDTGLKPGDVTPPQAGGGQGGVILKPGQKADLGKTGVTQTVGFGKPGAVNVTPGYGAGNAGSGTGAVLISPYNPVTKPPTSKPAGPGQSEVPVVVGKGKDAVTVAGKPGGSGVTISPGKPPGTALTAAQKAAAAKAAQPIVKTVGKGKDKVTVGMKAGGGVTISPGKPPGTVKPKKAEPKKQSKTGKVLARM